MSAWKQISKAERATKEVPKFPEEELKLTKSESNQANELSTTVSSGVKWAEGDMYIPLSLKSRVETENKFRR